MSKLKDLGGIQKYIVVKGEDVHKYLYGAENENFFEALDIIEYCREKDGKKIDNEYLVINLDEPYANEIIEILKRNGHWG
jgi:hypothetical protein